MRRSCNDLKSPQLVSSRLKYRDAAAEGVRDAFLVEQRHQSVSVGRERDPPPQQDAVAVLRHGGARTLSGGGGGKRSRLQ